MLVVKCLSVCCSGLMSEVDYIILDEWYRWIVENHSCHVDQIGLFSVSSSSLGAISESEKCRQ